MSPTGTVHFVFSLLAIATGAVVLRLPKGTRWHRTWGHGYMWSMAGLVVTSFLMFNLTGRVTPFHFAALVAALTIGAGMFSVLWRRPRGQWIEAHATWMAWSYVGLMAAFTAETLTRFVMPLLGGYLETRSLWGAFWVLVGIGTFAAVAAGWWLVRTRLPASIAKAPGTMREERRVLRTWKEGAKEPLTPP